jgi:exopolysaccharide production protein ExoQ
MTEGLRGNRLIAVGLGLNLVLLAGSRSLTSQVVFVASVVLILTVGRFVRFIFRHAAGLGMVVAPLLFAIVATVTIDDLLSLLAGAGKDATMSSRIPLWQQLLIFIEQRPLLGWGYDAFFTDANYAFRIIEEKIFFKPYYAHNGYLEVLLGLGAVGFAAMIWLFLRFTWMAARQLFLSDSNPLFLLCFIYVPVFIIQNTAEATILQRNSMSWALFVLLFLHLARASRASVRGPDVSLSGRRLPVPRVQVN